MARAAEGVQRPAGPYPSRRDRGDTSCLPRCGSRHRDDGFVQRQPHFARRLRVAGAGVCHRPCGGAGGPARGGRLHAGASAARTAFRERFGGTHEQVRLHRHGHERHVASRSRFRRARRSLRPSDRGIGGRRCGPCPVRDLFRYAQLQGGRVRRRGGVRLARTPASPHRVGDAHQQRADALGADRGGLLRLGGACPAAGGRVQLFVRCAAAASLPPADGRCVGLSGVGLSQCGPPEPRRRIRGVAGRHGRAGGGVPAAGACQYRGRLLRHHARTHTCHRTGGGALCAPAAARAEVPDDVRRPRTARGG